MLRVNNAPSKRTKPGISDEERELKPQTGFNNLYLYFNSLKNLEKNNWAIDALSFRLDNNVYLDKKHITSSH